MKLVQSCRCWEVLHGIILPAEEVLFRATWTPSVCQIQLSFEPSSGLSAQLPAAQQTVTVAALLARLPVKPYLGLI